jgi:steroid 5-alpha reductase family enzyme
VSLAELLGVSIAVVAVAMTALWLLSLALKNAGIVDIFWGLGFVLLAAVYFVAADGFAGRKLLVLALVAVWGLRLSGYIGWRNRGKGEDYRYARWREQAGERFWWTSLFQVFLLQGLLMWVISMPVLAAQSADEPDSLTVVDFLGTAIWAVGFFFEAVGDWQLARFKSDPANAGKVMRSGVWAYTRHPNYFGDATQWWGLYVIAAGASDGYWTLFSPVLMTVLLLRVSGVALLERAQVRTKPQYADYIESTSAFVPWFPRKRA